MQARKVNLISIDVRNRTAKTILLPIDSNIQEFTVSVSGEDPRIELIDPSGKNTLFKCHFILCRGQIKFPNTLRTA